MAGYIRQSTFVDGDTITAALFNNEYNQLVNAFSNTSGHKHDGTTAEGPVIGLIGDAGETSPNNKVLIDTTNNYIEFYVEVSSAPVQQLYIADGAIIPVTDSDIDLGTTSLRFKDTYTDTVTTTGNVSIGGDLTVTGSATISGNLTFGDADTDSINLAAEIDSNIVPNTDNTYDLGTATKEWRNLYIDGTANIDSLVADTADINGGTIDGATIATSDITVGAGKTLNVSAGTLTLADNQISGDKVEGGTIAATTITTLTSTTGNITNVNATTVDSTNLEVTNLKAKDGTAAGSIANTTGVVTLASSVLTTTDINGGTIDGVTIGGSSAGAVTFTDLSDGTITIAGFADEDNMVSDSATLLPTQQSVKAYVDSQVTAQDLDFQGDTGGALSIDLDSESLTIAGGTGIDTSGATNTLTVAIDSTVATLTGTQTLTNKTLTTPIISSISNTGTLTLPTSTDTLVGRATTDTLTNKTLTSPDVNTPDIDGGTIDGTVIGGATPAAADFTTMDTTGNASVGGNLSVTGDLTINGTTTTVNSTTVTIDDPIFTLGGDTAPASDDNKDRGIEFRWHNGTAAKVGFFGYDDSASVFTFIPDATNTSEVFSGSAGNVAFGNIAGTLTTAAQPNITSLGTLTGLTTTGDINFGDNDKAVFGTGSDLEIFHNGISSYIRDIGDGDLQIFATDDVYIRGYATNNYMARFNENGAVTLYHNNSPKFDTTSTGIDVTGTVTADGLTVNGESSVVALSDNAVFNVNVSGGTSKTSTINQRAKSSNGSNAETSIVVTGSSGEAVSAWDFKLDTVNGSLTKAMTIDGSGDISFYEDTGTTAKFFWDASAESLGIGTTSPEHPLHVNGGTANTVAQFQSTDANAYIEFLDSDAGASGCFIGGAGDDFVVLPNASEKFRVTSSGNVGIGTDSPDTLLHLSDTSGNSILRLERNDTSIAVSDVYGSIEFEGQDASSGSSGVRGSISGIAESTTGGMGIAFSTAPSGGSNTEVMRIDRSGNVGIGMTPAYRLDVTNNSSGIQGRFSSSSSSGTSLSFQNSATNGRNYRIGSNFVTGAGEFAIYDDTASAERMRIDSSGNVGIGTASPTANLEVSSASNPEISIASTAGATSNFLNFKAISHTQQIQTQLKTIDNGDFTSDLAFLFKATGTGGALSEKMRIDSSGNVGIGTSSPSAKLHVNGEAYFNAGTRHYTYDDQANFWSLYTNTDDSFRFNYNGAGDDEIVINTSGNCGIGTSSPEKRLHITDSTQANQTIRFGNPSATPYGEINYDSSGFEHLYITAKGTTTGYGNIVFNTGGTPSESMRIDTSGNVSVASSALGENVTGVFLLPTAEVRIKDSTEDGTSQFSIYNNNTTADSEQFFIANNLSSVDIGNKRGAVKLFSNGSEAMRIDASGNLLVGTTSSSAYATGVSALATTTAALINVGHINGTGSGNAYATFGYNNVGIGSITQNGTTGVAYNTSSDARLKDVTGEARGLEVINELNPVAYNWKADGKADEGLIAQEVKEIVPNAVTGSEEDYYQMDYSKLVVHLVKGMKEQQAQIEALQSEINELKNS